MNIYDGVIVYQCGFGSASSDTDNGGAVYVSNGGEFIMHGGLLLNNTGYKGGAVYVNNGGSFKLMEEGKGIITNNHALYSSGGGVWAESASDVKWTGGDIKGNTASSKCNNNENNIYPYVACPEKEAPIIVGYKYSDSDISSQYESCWSVKEAYDKMKNKGIKTFTIYVTRDFTQGYIETWDGKSYTTELDYITIEKGFTVNLVPYTESVNLNIIYQMFHASGKSFVIGVNGDASITISGKNEVNTVDKGGLILVDSGSVSINSVISDTKAENGGAIYINSGSCNLAYSTLITGCTAENGGAVYVEGGTFSAWFSGSITGCTAKNGGAVYVKGGTFQIGDLNAVVYGGSITGCTAENGGAVYVDGGNFVMWDSSMITDCTAKNGGAVYVNVGTFTMRGSPEITDCTAEIGGAVYFADGTFNVRGSAMVDSSNDVYLSAGQVITAVDGYSGTIGKITLPSYEEGRNVVDVTADSDISITKFTLNPEAHNEYGDKLLVHVVEDGKDFLELKTQPVYRITIPDSLHISSEDKYGTMPITAETVKIPINSWLSVTVVSEGNFNLTNTADNSAKLPYNLFIDESGVRVKNNLEVAHFTVTEYLEKQSVSSKLTERLNGTVTELPPVTGTYTDILTFSVEYKTT